MTAAIGPSGKNEVYLNRLDNFLEDGTKSSLEELTKFDDTIQLAAMEKTLRNYKLHFLFGSGSNQHNQLLLASETNAADLVGGEDAHVLKDIVFCTSCCDLGDAQDPVQKLFAGGGHSALLTQSGRLYMFGWKSSGQLGTSGLSSDTKVPIPLISELKDTRVETAALGFNHSLVIERDSGRVFAFGDNGRGQITGTPSVGSVSAELDLEGDQAVDVAAGLFHSAVVTATGELLTLGCGRFGQSLKSDSSQTVQVARWRPDDGTKIVRVGCGRRHTVALDAQGRVWTLGENKHGQLGRSLKEGFVDGTPRVVDGLEEGWKCLDIKCGWSHCVVLARNPKGATAVFGWGRNDKGQLGTDKTTTVLEPTRLFDSLAIESVDCGSESTVVVDTSGAVWSCGWNEHGNLATGGTDDSSVLLKALGAPISATPGYPKDSIVTIAAGGAHFIAMKVPNNSNN